jgi:cyclopropane fatty-acyl-phospholipid synthase-like methyltransferase
MDQSSVTAYFDRLAPTWDEHCTRSSRRIEDIFREGDIREGSRVLDVGCGNGILFSYFLAHSVKSAVGIDVSQEMLKVAHRRIPDDHIRLIWGDASSLSAADYPSHEFPEPAPGLNCSFDRIIVFNALPHFSDFAQLFSQLDSLLLPEGRLIIAHADGRETINSLHDREADSVSQPLPPVSELADRLPPDLHAICTRDEESLYCLCAVKFGSGSAI